MSKIKIIPAIDLIDGKCVRLRQGDFEQVTTYDSSPLEMAQMVMDAGFQRLHLVDLDGAKSGTIANLKVLEQIAVKTQLNIDFGGGVSSRTRFSDVLNAGAAMVAMGTVMVKNESLGKELAEEFGGEKIFLGADVRNKKVAVSGWLEQTEIEIMPFIKKWYDLGIKQFFVTDISKDGNMSGSALDLYEEILDHLPQIRLTASGGVSTYNEIEALEKLGLDGAIIGKAIYEGHMTLKGLANFN